MNLASILFLLASAILLVSVYLAFVRPRRNAVKPSAHSVVESSQQQKRPFGRATYVYWESQTNRIHEATQPSIKFHYRLINAELEDIKVESARGKLKLATNPLGDLLLDHKSKMTVEQGADAIINITREFTEKQAAFILQFRAEHLPVKDGHGWTYNGSDIWLTVRGVDSDIAHDVKMPDPGLYNP